jgi:hypothetical protein
MGKTSTTTLKASRQEPRSWELYSNDMNGDNSRWKADSSSKDWRIRRTRTRGTRRTRIYLWRHSMLVFFFFKFYRSTAGLSWRVICCVEVDTKILCFFQFSLASVIVISADSVICRRVFFCIAYPPKRFALNICVYLHVTRRAMSCSAFVSS